MFGRKARKIAELEARLADALENLVNVTIDLPPGLRQQIERLPKGVWYYVSFQWKVADDKAQISVRDASVKEASERSYFEGKPGTSWRATP